MHFTINGVDSPLTLVRANPKTYDDASGLPTTILILQTPFGEFSPGDFVVVDTAKITSYTQTGSALTGTQYVAAVRAAKNRGEATQADLDRAVAIAAAIGS